jgi:hypothetical protein
MYIEPTWGQSYQTTHLEHSFLLGCHTMICSSHWLLTDNPKHMFKNEQVPAKMYFRVQLAVLLLTVGLSCSYQRKMMINSVSRQNSISGCIPVTSCQWNTSIIPQTWTWSIVAGELIRHSISSIPWMYLCNVHWTYLRSKLPDNSPRTFLPSWLSHDMFLSPAANRKF